MRLPPEGTPARRRLAALVAAAGLALVAGAAIGAGGGGGGGDDAARPRATAPRPHGAAPPRPAVRAAHGLSLRRQAGQLVVMRFDGAEPPAYVARALRAGRAAGVILFKDNIASRTELPRLVRTLQRASGGAALVTTDQEGGAIRNLPWARPVAGQAAAATPAQAAAAARGAARDLRAAGINVNLAPVGDVAEAGSVMRGRAFPGGAQQVAALTSAAVRGYRGTGVAATVKHFPGLGAAAENTDDAPVTLARTPQQLLGEDLPPFRAAIGARVPLVMASHALYPSLDGDAIASQSRYVLQRLLRERLGFRGVVVTDSIEARAVTERGGPAEAAVRSVRAGADLVLTTGASSHLRVLRAIIAEARRSPAFRDRVAESAARVLALKRDLGLRAPPMG
jgi:beta-N-acetylhexosaminidase